MCPAASHRRRKRRWLRFIEKHATDSSTASQFCCRAVKFIDQRRPTTTDELRSRT